MRSLVVTSLALLVLSGAALAQSQGEREKVPNPFEEDQWKLYNAIGQELGQAFQYKEYEKGLELLKKQMVMLEKVLTRIEKGEAGPPEMAEKQTRWVKMGHMQGNWYNQACCLSMTADKAGALDALKKAVGLGWVDVDHMKIDTDLDPIRNEAAFKAIVEALNYNDVYEVFVPEGITGPAPVLMALHSARSNETKFIEEWKELAKAAKVILVAPRAPMTMSLESYDWKRRSDDEKGALKKIAATLDAVKAKHQVDPARVYIMGVGNGGYFASLAALMHPDVYKGAISINAYWNKYYFEDFLDKAKAGGLKLHLLQGKENPLLKRAQDAVKQLEGKGIPAKLTEFEGSTDLPKNISDLVAAALTWIVAG
ncbi:MAG: alpha/beta hydrolase [Planctomycetota bacterium]|jgi:predicted esterase